MPQSHRNRLPLSSQNYNERLRGYPRAGQSSRNASFRLLATLRALGIEKMSLDGLIKEGVVLAAIKRIYKRRIWIASEMGLVNREPRFPDTHNIIPCYPDRFFRPAVA